MNQRMVIGAVLGLVMVGCARTPREEGPITVVAPRPATVAEAMELIDQRAEWTELGQINVARHPAEKYLKGMTIVIDPGHGGTDGGNISTQPAGYKAGHAGEKEAFINFRVAVLLNRLLKDAGVNVIMTRYGDDTISLRERAEVANNAKKLDGSIGADLFISIHHNAYSNRSTNFTSIWYHGDANDAEVSLDVARHVAERLGEGMRTQVGVSGLLFSDKLMYESGFGVLRACKVPCFLCECSFFTNPAEEQRLRDAKYNLREAYAIYTALCEYAYEGRPTQSMPEVTMAGSSVHVSTLLDEGLPGWWGKDLPRILKSTIDVTVDGKRVGFEFDERSKALTANLEQLKAGEHVLGVHFANMYKHHNWPQRYRFVIAGDEGTRTIEKVEALGTVRSVYVDGPSTRRGRRGATSQTTQPATTQNN
jgi:N-acetylmuramoyl-L-alanine amidase